MVGRTAVGRKLFAILIVTALLMTLALPSVALGGQGQWTRVGPSGAEVMSIAFSPNYASDKTLFVGTYYNGVLKSTDGGASWAEVNNGISSEYNFLCVNSIAISPSYATDNTLFAGAGWHSGVYKSTDGGASWTQISPGYDVTTLALSPNYAIDKTLFIGTQWDGAFKSTNGGANWIQINSGVLSPTIHSIAFSPNYIEDGTVFAGTEYPGVLKSTDGGESWIQASNGLSNTQVWSIALSPNYATDSTLFAGASSGGIFKSTDGGASWIPVNNGLVRPNIHSLALSPNYQIDETLFAGSLRAWGPGVYKSTDGGASWTRYYVIDNNVTSLALSPDYSADGTVFAGTYGCGVLSCSFDVTPPTTTLTTNPSSPDGSNGWFKSTATVTLANSKPGTTYYQWDTDTAAWTTYEGSFSVPEGKHTLHYYSVDQAGNREATKSKAINVDLTTPTLSAPQDMTIEATGPDGATANFEATATDNLTTSTIAYSKNPGSTFPLGDTSVTVTATDEAGNSTTKSFNVRVQDTTPPVITVPQDMTLEATGPDGATVSFEATATDAVGPVGVTYSQNPGTIFSPGETTVTVTATDAAGNSATKSFKVTVNFSWSGFSQPISIDPNKVSVVKAGSTLPVKFKLTDVSAGITDGKFYLYVTDLDASGGTEEMAAVSTSQAITGNLFRYDATSGQYIFNLSTKGFVSGHTYRLRVDLGDGTVNTVQFLVK